MPEAMKNFCVPLPESVHRSLEEEAKRAGRPATDLAREAIARWLAEVHRRKIHEEIARYAAEFAGTRADLDPLLEKAAAEHLLRIEEEGD